MISFLRPKRSDRSPPTSELITFDACSAAHNSGIVTTATPTSRARKSRKASDEFDKVNKATSTRKRLKLLSKPRKLKRGGASAGCAAAVCVSRTKKMATSTDANAGTAAHKKIVRYSLALGAFLFAASHQMSAKPMSGPMIAP